MVVKERRIFVLECFRQVYAGRAQGVHTVWVLSDALTATPTGLQPAVCEAERQRRVVYVFSKCVCTLYLCIYAYM